MKPLIVPVDAEEVGSEYRPTLVTDFPAEYGRLRQESPVVHSSDFGGFWTILKHEDVSRASRDWKKFLSRQPFVEYKSFSDAIPISTNPPQHTYFRKFLNQYFKPDRVAALVPEIERSVADLLDPFISGGGGDIYRDVIRLIPPGVLARLLGLSDSGWEALSERLAEADAVRHDVTAFGRLQANLWTASVEELIADRTERPRDPSLDIMSGIRQLEPQGRPITHEEMLNLGTQLFAAGADTTIAALGSLTVHFATHLEDQKALRARPDLIPAAIEEVLRLSPPIHQTTRHASEPMVMAGQAIGQNDLVALNVASANRDEDKFTDADKFRLDRQVNPHLTFGFGPHMCIGAPVAREELRIFAEQLLTKTRRFTIDQAPEPGGRPLRSGWASVTIRVEGL
ncbi:cytochrome P450 [Cryobacterium sp. N19]|uniref:cytochrome P450 n=1 Tax=Cryobacterium sp. N19 TaxID=2048288 RepID=UPI000CE52CC7|nr:cytochrome P450 [Cryobacterium sp. N19]